MVSKDFDLIVNKFPRDVEQITLYPLGDVHVGSDEFDEVLFEKWLKMVESDPTGVVVLVGDMIDNGLKNSKTNSYEAKMRPRDQKMYVATQLKRIADKILLGVAGNHEYRSALASDDCPLYDIMAKLNLEHLYRENYGFLKINVGEKSKERQFSYAIAVGHGSSKRKAEIFSYVIDNVDVFVTGHVHQPKIENPARIVIDMHNEVVREEEFLRLVTPSFMRVGGYGLRAMYEPAGHKFQRVILSGTEKEFYTIWR